MNQHPIVNITVKWETFGWVASTPDWPSTSRHAAGPRTAAEDLCREMFGPNPHTITFKAKGWYEAQLKGER
jgi:hypothetical protein